MSTPIQSTAGAVTLAHLTDSHLFGDPQAELMGVNTHDNLEGVLAHMKQHSRQPQLLLATGDLAQDGSPAAYTRFIELAGRLGLPLHGLPGNHDTREPFYATLGSRAQPVVELEHWRIVLLDTLIPGEDGGHLDDAQLRLLDRLANDGDPRHLLLAMHHHPVPMHSEWLDTMIIDNAQACSNASGMTTVCRPCSGGMYIRPATAACLLRRAVLAASCI